MGDFGTGPAWSVRSLRTPDREDVVRLRSSASAMASLDELEATVPASFERYERVLGAHVGQRLVGCAALSAPPFLGPGARSLLVVVDPACRRRGLGATLHRALLQPLPAGTVVWASTDDADGPAGPAFAGALGYRQALHHLTQQLDLAAAPVGPVAPAHVGVTVHPMTGTDPAAPGSDPELTAALTDLMLEADTSPEAAHVPDRSWPMLLDNWSHLGQDGVVVLAHDLRAPDPSRPVSLACARPPRDGSGDPHAWHLMMTATRPDARRRGFAGAVKQRLHAEVLARGGRTLTTVNEAGNPSVLAMNEALGYRLVASQRRWTLTRPRSGAPAP